MSVCRLITLHYISQKSLHLGVYTLHYISQKSLHLGVYLHFTKIFTLGSVFTFHKNLYTWECMDTVPRSHVIKSSRLSLRFSVLQATKSWMRAWVRGYTYPAVATDPGLRTVQAYIGNAKN